MNKKSYLPSDSQPWARELEKEINDTSDVIRLNKINSDNELYQLKSSVSQLNKINNQLMLQDEAISAQGEYLSTLRTYVTTSPEAVTINCVDGGPANYIVKELSLDFYLSRPANIILSARVSSVTNDVQSSRAAFYRINSLGYQTQTVQSSYFNYNLISVNGSNNIVRNGFTKGDNTFTAVMPISEPGLMKLRYYLLFENQGTGTYITVSDAVFSARVVN